MNSHIKTLTLLLIAVFLYTGCDSTGSDNDKSLVGLIHEDIPANIDPRIEGFPEDIQDNPGEVGKYTFYSLSNDRTVQDSTSADWDIAFAYGMTELEILANSANGGGIQLVLQPYDEVEHAPEDGYSESTGSLSGFMANPEGEWFIYSGRPDHIVRPNKNATIVIKTPDGKYAKVEIVTYYKGNPDMDSEEFKQTSYAERNDSYYTFNYTLVTDGSTDFTHEDETTFFDLVTGDIVEDSTSSQWNVGFNATNIYGNVANGGGVQLLNIEFDDVVEAPIEGYAEMPNTDWYKYTLQSAGGPKHAIIPRSGKTIVVKTPDDKYAKFRVISYYKGNPDISSDEFMNDLAGRKDRHYTIEYVVQEDGSRFFK